MRPPPSPAVTPYSVNVAGTLLGAVRASARGFAAGGAASRLGMSAGAPGGFARAGGGLASRFDRRWSLSACAATKAAIQSSLSRGDGAVRSRSGF